MPRKKVRLQKKPPKTTPKNPTERMTKNQLILALQGRGFDVRSRSHLKPVYQDLYQLYVLNDNVPLFKVHVYTELHAFDLTHRG